MSLRVYSTAVGCSCLLGTGLSPVGAAEWSMTPVFSWSVDHDSNRLLVARAKSSESTILVGDLKLMRALETTQLSLEPRFTFRRYTVSNLGNGDDRALSAGLLHTGERTRLNLSASYEDESTLTTELLETGITRGDTHRKLAQASGTWTWTHSEGRQLTAQLSYADVSYYGQASQLLPGYRYPTVSLGERFQVSERTSWTVSAFENLLSSDAARGSIHGSSSTSHEQGLQVELVRSLSELTLLDASVAGSKRSLNGVQSYGTDASLSITHDYSLGNIGLSYTRNLVPYGIGFLVERQQLTLTGLRRLAPHLDASLSVLRVQNSQSAVQLGVDRRNYDSAALGLNWRESEHWSLGAQVSTSRSELPTSAGTGTASEWRAALTVTWNPRPRTRSW